MQKFFQHLKNTRITDEEIERKAKIGEFIKKNYSKF